MGWEFFKGLLEGIIKIDNRKYDNRQIIIKDRSTLVCGNQTITDKQIVDKVFQEIEKHKDTESLPFHVIHEDLHNSYDDFENISMKDKQTIKKLKEILPNEEVECILFARRVQYAFDSGDVIKAKKLQINLEKDYPDKGYRVLNLIGAGYFDEMIIPFIEVFKSKFDDKYITEYQKFYLSIIHFFPLAVFVGNGKTIDNIKKELSERIKLNIPFIRLHAIGENNIDKITEVINDLKLDDDYSIKDERFTTPTKLKAQILEIKLISKKQE